MKARAVAQCKALVQFIVENAEKLEAGEAEVAIFDRLLEVGRTAMRVYFHEKGLGDVGPTLAAEDGRVYWREKRLHRRTYLSIFGKVEVSRCGYRHRGEPAIFPLDAQANLPEGCHSYPLQQLLDEFSMNGPFVDGTGWAWTWLHLAVSDHTAEIVSREASADYQGFYDQKPAPEPAPEEESLVVSLDGKGVPMIKAEAAKIQAKPNKGEKRQKKKEALVGVCYTVGPKARTAEEVAENLVYPERAAARRQAEGEAREAEPKARDIRRVASLRPKEEVVAEIVREAEKRDPGHERALPIVIDGDPGLRRLAETAFQAWPATHRFVILDIIHVKGYLWDAAHALYREGADDAAAYVQRQLVEILRGRVGYVIGSLKSSLKKRGLRGGRAAALRRAIRYFSKRRAMMRYDVYLHWGFPIASGVVESSCNALVRNRMEGCGMRWSLEGAEAMLRLRSVHLSGDWEDYWAYRIQGEKQRLYGHALTLMKAAA
jgi:hypothetical protein